MARRYSEDAFLVAGQHLQTCWLRSPQSAVVRTAAVMNRISIAITFWHRDSMDAHSQLGHDPTIRRPDVVFRPTRRSGRLGAARVLGTSLRTDARKYAAPKLCTEPQWYTGREKNGPSEKEMAGSTLRQVQRSWPKQRRRLAFQRASGVRRIEVTCGAGGEGGI
jgi:hypothetical protein